MTNLTSTTNSIESSFNFENIREIVKLCLIKYSSVELVIYIIRWLHALFRCEVCNLKTQGEYYMYECYVCSYVWIKYEESSPLDFIPLQYRLV